MAEGQDWESSITKVPRSRRESAIVGTGFAPSGPAISDQTLLGRLQRGDEAALGALYERYAPLLYALAVRVVGDRQLAQEVTEEPAPGSPAPTGPHLLDRRI
jgi:hypothetical protein